MYRETFQNNYLTIFNADGPQPLRTWKSHVKTGWVRRVWDYDLSALALELKSTNVSTCAVESGGPLGVYLPYLVLIMKNLRKYFTFKITVLDDGGMRRRFRFSNFQSRTCIGTFECTFPLCLNAEQPWNMIRIDLPRLTKQAFSSVYAETVSVSIHANCRLRRIYFCRVLLPDNELPPEYGIFIRYRTRTERQRVKEITPPPQNFLVPPPTPSVHNEESAFEEVEDENVQDNFILKDLPSIEELQKFEVDSILSQE